jgi:hypothetical protein
VSGRIQSGQAERAVGCRQWAAGSSRGGMAAEWQQNGSRAALAEHIRCAASSQPPQYMRLSPTPRSQGLQVERGGVEKELQFKRQWRVPARRRAPAGSAAWRVVRRAPGSLAGARALPLSPHRGLQRAQGGTCTGGTCTGGTCSTAGAARQCGQAGVGSSRAAAGQRAAGQAAGQRAAGQRAGIGSRSDEEAEEARMRGNLRHGVGVSAGSEYRL